MSNVDHAAKTAHPDVQTALSVPVPEMGITVVSVPKIDTGGERQF